MKKILLFILCSLSANAIFANETVVLVNSNQNDITATYKICSLDAQGQETCNNDITTVIKAKKTTEDKNYITFTPATTVPFNISHIFVKVLSVTEQDETGKIIAQGNYLSSGTATCLGETYTNYQYAILTDSILALDDMNQSPFIACNKSSFFIANNTAFK
jgi:hypothetical protein